MKRHLLSILLLCGFSLFGSTPIHYLKPPQLAAPENFGKRVLCHRPMRRGAPKMEIEHRGDKIIVHNYGHGGSGWTLGPGCARYLVQKFSNEQRDLEDPVVVVGAGALGLFSAYELVKSGYTNITIIAEKFEGLASHNAGGFLAPSTMDVDKKMQDFIDQVSFDAYHFYQQIAQGNNTDFPAEAARIMPVYLKRYDTRLLSYEGVVMQKPSDVVIDFGNGKQYEMKVYEDGIYMDTSLLMQALTDFLKNKVNWVQKKVMSFDELQAPCIFNCTGLGAHDLNTDEAMVSVQGHLLLLEHQNPDDMNYIISFYGEPGKTENGQYAKRSIYMFPKHVPGTPEHAVGVMGGTFIEGADAITPNESEFEMIMQRSREFFGQE